LQSKFYKTLGQSLPCLVVDPSHLVADKNDI